MTTRNLFLFNAIVVLGFGPLMLLIPHEILHFYAAETFAESGVSNTVARGYGTILTGLGAAMITSLNAPPSIARRGLLMLITVTNLLAVLLHITVILQGIENGRAWSLVAITGILAIWGGYLLAKEMKLRYPATERAL